MGGGGFVGTVENPFTDASILTIDGATLSKNSYYEGGFKYIHDGTASQVFQISDSGIPQKNAGIALQVADTGSSGGLISWFTPLLATNEGRVYITNLAVPGEMHIGGNMTQNSDLTIVGDFIYHQNPLLWTNDGGSFITHLIKDSNIGPVYNNTIVRMETLNTYVLVNGEHDKAEEDSSGIYQTYTGSGQPYFWPGGGNSWLTGGQVVFNDPVYVSNNMTASNIDANQYFFLTGDAKVEDDSKAGKFFFLNGSDALTAGIDGSNQEKNVCIRTDTGLVYICGSSDAPFYFDSAINSATSLTIPAGKYRIQVWGGGGGGGAGGWADGDVLTSKEGGGGGGGSGGGYFEKLEITPSSVSASITVGVGGHSGVGYLSDGTTTLCKDYNGDEQVGRIGGDGTRSAVSISITTIISITTWAYGGWGGHPGSCNDTYAGSDAYGGIGGHIPDAVQIAAVAMGIPFAEHMGPNGNDGGVGGIFNGGAGGAGANNGGVGGSAGGHENWGVGYPGGDGSFVGGGGGGGGGAMSDVEGPLRAGGDGGNGAKGRVIITEMMP